MCRKCFLCCCVVWVCRVLFRLVLIWLVWISVLVKLEICDMFMCLVMCLSVVVCGRLECMLCSNWLNFCDSGLGGFFRVVCLMLLVRFRLVLIVMVMKFRKIGRFLIIRCCCLLCCLLS